MSELNLYKATANKETHYARARSQSAAMSKIRRRLLGKYGRCEITDIREVTSTKTLIPETKN